MDCSHSNCRQHRCERRARATTRFKQQACRRAPGRPIHLLRLKIIGSNHGELAAEIAPLPQVLAQGHRHPHQPADRRAFDDYRLSAGAGGARFATGACARGICVQKSVSPAAWTSRRRMTASRRKFSRVDICPARNPAAACARESALNGFRHAARARSVVDAGDRRCLAQAATALFHCCISAASAGTPPVSNGGQTTPATLLCTEPGTARSSFNCCVPGQVWTVLRQFIPHQVCAKPYPRRRAFR